MEFFKRYAYIILAVMCVLALGGLYMVGRSRPAGVVDSGHTIVSPRDVYASVPGDLGAGPDAAVIHGAVDAPDVTDDTQRSVTGDISSETVGDAATTPPPATIGVHIAGEVYSPGFREVPYGSRVNCVVELAGGLTQYADMRRINLAAFVQDADQIIIPAVGEELPEAADGWHNQHNLGGQSQDGHSQGGHNQGGQGQGVANAGGFTADGRVNINLATLTELQTLPGVGPVIAQNIIDHREVNGGFSSIEELINVSRIGQATLDNLRDLIAVE